MTEVFRNRDKLKIQCPKIDREEAILAFKKTMLAKREFEELDRQAHEEKMKEIALKEQNYKNFKDYLNIEQVDKIVVHNPRNLLIYPPAPFVYAIEIIYKNSTLGTQIEIEIDEKMLNMLYETKHRQTFHKSYKILHYG
jgi:hypothetical protein